LLDASFHPRVVVFVIMERNESAGDDMGTEVLHVPEHTAIVVQAVDEQEGER
jgi:hypothetical protein